MPACPRTEFISPRSASSFRTIAVELSETSSPVNTAGAAGTPNAIASPATRPVVSTTCSPPPITISRRIWFSRSSENSSPIVNSSRITPISATRSTTSGSATRPSWCGPTTTPASRNPTIGTTRIREHT